MSDERRDIVRPHEVEIEEGGWQKPVSPPTSKVRPPGLPPKPEQSDTGREGK